MILHNKSKLLYETLPITVISFILLCLSPISVEGASDSNRIVLGLHYEVFHDSTNNVTIEDLIAGTYDNYFIPSSQKYPFYWHTSDTIWLRLPLNKIIQGSTNGYVIEGIDKQDHVYVYMVKEDGTYSTQKGGISGLDNQPIRYRSNLFTINEPDVAEVYISLSGDLPLLFTSYLYKDISFIESVISYKFLTGLFYGFIMALMLYNLFLYYSLKERAYLYYVFYMFCFMTYQATMNSFDLELVGHTLPEWFLYRTLPLSCVLLVYFMILFGKEFLELKTHLPKHNLVLNIFLWLTVLSLLAVFIVPNLEVVNNAVTSLTVVVTALLWVSGLTMLLKGFKMARFYMVGWTVLLGTILFQGLGFLGILPFHAGIYETLPAIAACFEAIFLSLALGDKINLMKKEMNDKLEERVQERTKELEAAKETLEEMQNIRAKMLANIAHDLGSPIQGIQMYLQLIGKGTIETVDERILSELNEKSIYINRLIHDLFELSKLELKKLPFYKEELSAKEFTEYIYRKFEHDLKHKNIDFRLGTLEPTINGQEGWIAIDRLRITQVLQNFIDNAVKFSKGISNTITFNCYCVNSTTICFEIIDYGLGMEQDDVSQVFNRFYKKKELNDDGSGLGLTISKEIIEQHLGKVGVISKKGEGSTFYFYLPLIEHNRTQEN